MPSELIPARPLDEAKGWYARTVDKWRRLSKDYEQSPRSEEAFLQTAMIGLMLNRMAE